MKFGNAARRLRHSQGRTLQQLCDATDGQIQTGYLSRIERDELTPNVYVAAAIARALGTTIDSLLHAGPAESAVPTESRKLLPVLEWDDVWQFVGGGTPPDPTGWVMPPMPAGMNGFGLVLRDDSMQALEGISWARGGVIIVDPSREANPGDYVLISDQSDGGMLIFRQLISDGRDRMLRARNPQFPMRQIDESWKVVGVVIGQVVDISH